MPLYLSLETRHSQHLLQLHIGHWWFNLFSSPEEMCVCVAGPDYGADADALHSDPIHQQLFGLHQQHDRLHPAGPALRFLPQCRHMQDMQGGAPNWGLIHSAQFLLDCRQGVLNLQGN